MNFFSIRDGWNWWLAQLASILLPADPRKQAGRLASAELLIGRKRIQLFRGAHLVESLKSTQCVQSDELLESAARSLKKRENVIISLDDVQCFCREVTLPAAVGTRIQNVLDLDVSRVTPFSRDDVFNAWYLIGQTSSGSALIEQVLIRKSIVAEAIAAIAKVGARPVAIVVRRQGGPALPFVLDKDGSRYGYKSFEKWAKIAVISLCAVTASFALLAMSGIQRQSRILAAIEDQVAIEEKSAIKVRQHVDRIETASREVQSLQQFRQSQKSVLDVWEELSRILPDSAWLQSLSFSQASVTAEGLAESAEDLISLLEESPFFERVKFASPVYQDPEQKRARFSITFELAQAQESKSP